MFTHNTAEFVAYARQLPDDFGPATAKAAFLVAPDGFALATQSASDNTYMATAEAYNAETAQQAHRRLHLALSSEIPTICFAGSPETPDAVFGNNVFGTTANQRLIVGKMLHPVRQKEAKRTDIRQFFLQQGYSLHDLAKQPHPCELTGALVIDRLRGLGWCGLTERCNEAGAQLMHKAFGLRATLCFDLAASEYHTNVVLAILAGRAAIVCPAGFADPQVVQAVQQLYPQTLVCSPEQHASFVGNAISLSDSTVWMSSRAANSLDNEARKCLQAANFEINSVEISALEVAGGSLRCCVTEIF